MIKNLTVRPSYYDGVCFLTWSGVNEVTNVMRSRNGKTAWEVVAESLSPMCEAYVDTDALVSNRVIHYFYKIVSATDESNVKNAYTLPKLEQNGVINFIINETLLELRAGSGIPMSILSKNGEGAYCPKCVDVETGQVLNARCSNCGGTGRVDAYFTPVKTLVQILNSTKVDTKAEVPPNQARQYTYVFRTVNIPSIKEGDIFINLNTDDRYMVDSLESFDFCGTLPLIVHLTTSLLNRDNPAYSISV